MATRIDESFFLRSAISIGSSIADHLAGGDDACARACAKPASAAGAPTSSKRGLGMRVEKGAAGRQA